MKVYAVAKGKTTGIFNTWEECQESVKGISGAIYKSFKGEYARTDAENFLRNSGAHDSESAQEIKKEKVSRYQIIVTGTKDKPYFEIEYDSLSDNKTHVGYSSYDLNIVFGYLDDYFEIVN